jgi:hypothetical protein
LQPKYKAQSRLPQIRRLKDLIFYFFNLLICGKYVGNPDFCAMKILLTAATTFEIEPTLQLLEKNGLASAYEVEVLITGIGPVNATYLLTTTILNNKPDLVMQAGIAGSFNLNDLPAGKTVLVKYDALGDLGMEEKGNFTTHIRC